MGLFDKVFSSDKIKVEFINNTTGKSIGVAEMPPDQLPETFSVPTTMHLHGDDWAVDEAMPENAVDFMKSKQLVLKLRKIEKVDPQDMLFTLPSISNELPGAADRCRFNDFEVSIHEDDWRQKEFLTPASLPLIDIEIAKIKDIWEHDSQKIEDSFTAFKKCHVRDTIGAPDLSIDLGELKKLLNVTPVGSLKINGAFVANGFSLKTEHTTYFGSLAGDEVDQLCIADWGNDSVPEIVKITRELNLVFVNWYHADVVANEHD